MEVVTAAVSALILNYAYKKKVRTMTDAAVPDDTPTQKIESITDTLQASDNTAVTPPNDAQSVIQSSDTEIDEEKQNELV